MTDVEVHVERAGRTRRAGLLRRHPGRRTETVSFEYEPSWLADPEGFAIDPSLPLTRGTFAVPGNQVMFGALGDTTPDTWGRRLLQRAERRAAQAAGQPVRALMEADYLLGVADETRLGALRFRRAGRDAFEAPLRTGVPTLLELERLLQVTDRVLRDEDTAEDLRLILAPGSSLGGARPKASVIDRHGVLAIAKFPKETDEYSLETWEEIALRLAAQAGIAVPVHRLVQVSGRAVLISRRFDRDNGTRIPFLSAMSLTGLADGEGGSYPDVVDALATHGAETRADSTALFRRMVFNVLVSNVDDHLRNHGFLRRPGHGWSLSPAYDLNPTPADLRPRILTTRIDLDDGTCSLDLVESAAGFFGLDLMEARAVVGEVGRATARWREVAAAAGARPAEVARMASAFEHDDSRRAVNL